MQTSRARGPAFFWPQLFRRRQTGCFPGPEAAGHGMDVFVTHFLQVFSSERRSPAASAMTNDHSVWVGSLFFNLELDRAATDVSGSGNVPFIPFIFVADID